MWYEILIPTGILCVTTSLPAVLCPLWHRFILHGNPFNRYTDDPWVEHFWFRDHHLSHPFKPNGLESLPDEPPEQYRKKK